MRKSIIVGVACGLFVVTSVSKYLISKKNNNKDKFLLNEDYTKPKEETYIDLRKQREHAAATILERHNAAAQIIRETLEENTYNEHNSNNKVDFDEIDNNLNKLLDEE